MKTKTSRTKSLLILSTLTLSFNSFANIAKVAMVRGNAMMKVAGKGDAPLKLDDWVPEGATIVTKEKSVVKLTFTDKSQMNIGPNSEMAINKFGGGEAGLISVIKGQIRSQVTKDVLKHDDKSKLLIKTKSAAMGIRGTDFSVAFNEENNNTALITYEGNVSLAQINEAEAVNSTPAQFEQIVSDPGRAVPVTEGLYAGANPNLDHATIPTKISPVQYEQMKTNETFEEKKAESSEPQKSYNSPIPPGVSTLAATNSNTETLESQVKTEVGAEVIAEQAKELTAAVNTPPAEGYVDPNTGAVAPIAGGFIDMKTGIYIAPPPGSVFDPNTGVYVPPASYGTVDASGSYKAPEGLKLTSDGQFIPDTKPAAGGGSNDSGAAKPQGENKSATATAATGAAGAGTVTAAAAKAATETGKPGAAGTLATGAPKPGDAGAGKPAEAPKPAGPVIIPVTAQMATGPTFAPVAEVAQQVVQMIASTGGNILPPPPPVNDVLGGGFFIPGNYFIDTVPTNIAAPVVINETSKVTFTISAP